MGIWDIIVPTISGILMLIIMFLRYFQLNRTGYHQYIVYNRTLKIRIILIICCIVLSLSQFFTSLFIRNSSNYNSGYKGIYVLMCLVFSTQIGIILYEYHKNVPQMIFHRIFWLICFISNSIYAIIVLIKYNQNQEQDFSIVSNILLYLLIIFEFALIGFSFFVRKQDRIEFEDVKGFGVMLPNLSENRQNMIPVENSFIGNQQYNFSQFKIHIHFSKQWKIIQQENGEIDATITLKIFLSNPVKHYEIKKTMSDFVELERKLISEDQFGNEIYRLPQDFFRFGNESQQSFNDKLEMIKIYLRRLVSKQDYFLPSLIEFLEFDEFTKISITREQKSKTNSFDVQF